MSLFTSLTSYHVAFTMALWPLMAISSDSGRGRKCLRAVLWVPGHPHSGRARECCLVQFKPRKAGLRGPLRDLTVPSRPEHHMAEHGGARAPEILLLQLESLEIPRLGSSDELSNVF